MSKNIAVVGCGKRFQTIYFDILDKLDHNLFLWNRDDKKIKSFLESKEASSEKYRVIEELEDLSSLEIDLTICTIPDQARDNIVEKILDVTSSAILVETPVTDQILINMSLNNQNRIGVIEQWPHLPLEQFKRQLYINKVVSPPYWVYNDGRTYDYHGIAQLRAYIGYQAPSIIKGAVMNVEQPGHIDNTGKMNATTDFWTHGHVHMENGALLSHSFCYNCKVSDLKPIQMIKAYSADGSIVTGRINELNNDYELAEVRYINENKEAVVEKIEVSKIDDVTSEIKAAGTVWVNKYLDLGFNDQQTAIAEVIEMGLSGGVYPVQESFIDNVIVSAMKQSGVSHQVLKTS